MISEGPRRLSVFFGLLGALGWLTIVLYLFLRSSQDPNWVRFCTGTIAGGFISFIIPFGMVRGITWVVDGFRKDK
jgi:H+/Cl- antiporter ClcA